MKAELTIAAVFVIAVLFERGDADKDGAFWAIVAGGVVGVVAVTAALRSRGGIGATNK